MDRRITGLIGGALAIVLASGVAHAQDHLLCYKMVDSAQISAAVDMFAAQPEFTQQHCSLVKPIEFCVPASKQNVEPATAVIANVPGQPLQDDYICYAVKCPKQVLPPSKRVLDQFGKHLEQRYQPTKVCVPASKAVVPCGSFSTTSNKCGGECPATAVGLDQKCALVNGQCGCVPATCGGRPDKGGMCGGGCPNVADVCRPSASATGAVTCQCQAPGSPCGLNAAGMCGGDCTQPGAQCLPDPAGCSCQLTGQGGGTTPVCDQVAGVQPLQCNNGICPPGTECKVTQVPGATAASCGCVPKSCAKDAAGACTGTCPNGAPCGPDPLNGSCTCLPAPCGPDLGTSPPTCGGDCTTGECLPDPTTNQCACLRPCGPDASSGQCGGVCPNPGDTCVQGPAGTPCTCAHPATPNCGFFATGMCGGVCPTGQTCKLVKNNTLPGGLDCLCK